MKFKGKDIKRLIPQRKPFIMVDGFEGSDDNNAVTTLSVCPNNYFILSDDTLAETGLIEHLAQSCSALAGWQVLSKAPLTEAVSPVDGDTPPPVGLIGEVKRFNCLRRPQVGERIKSTITFGMTFGNVTVATGQSFVDEEMIADIKLKIFIQ